MTNTEMNTKVYEKLFDEQQKYKGWLLQQSPEEILNHAYEYTVREDIVLAMEYHDLTDERAKALLSSPSPLNEIFHDFEQIKGGHMDVIRGCIETRADDILEAQRLALLQLPIYPETAAYAREHKDDLKQIANSIKFADKLPPDFAVVLLKDYMSINKDYRTTLLKIPEFTKWFNTKGRLLNGII